MVTIIIFNWYRVIESIILITTAATQITSATAGDALLAAYQNDNAYIYQATSADTAVIASEITLIGTLNGISRFFLVLGDF